MKQPVMVILDLPDGSDLGKLGPSIERALRSQAFDVQWAIPVSYELEVPKGAITA